MDLSVVITTTAQTVGQKWIRRGFHMTEQFVVVCDYLAGGCGLCVGGSHYNKESALRAWNNRTTPPIGRCKECKHFKNYECTNDYISTDNEGGASYSLNFYVNDYCSYFEMNCQNS